MKRNSLVACFACGLIFAFGLGLSGMTQPSKVIGFLDVFGNWDPSLIFVMGGALVVHAIAYQWILRSRIRAGRSPLLAEAFDLPNKTNLTWPLAIGASLFGIGWGLVGYCPAPALVSLASLQIEPVLFVIAMIGGMFCAKGAVKNTSS